MRHRMSKEERHRHILAVANQLFQEHGYEHVTIADVIEASNVARGTFYLHFKSLEEVLTALFEQAVDDTWERIAPLIRDETMPFRDCAVAVLRAAFQLFSDEESILYGSGGGRLFRRKRQQVLYNRLGGLIVEASRQRQTAPIPHLEWTVAILASIVGEMSYYAATHESLQDDVARSAFLDHVMDFALTGLEHQVSPFVQPTQTGVKDQ